MLWCVETLRFFKVLMCVGSMLWLVRSLSFGSSPVCGPCKCAVVCGDCDIFHKALLCVGRVRTVCGLHDVACENFEFSKFSWCVSSVLWCVRTLSFLNSHVCGPCAVACED